MKRLRRTEQAGDTIVEVLMVLAIVGLALGISYGVANRSLVGVRKSQEHSQALQIAQGQIERLRSAIAKNIAAGVSLNGLKPPVGQYICFKTDGSIAPQHAVQTPPPVDLSDTNCLDGGVYATEVTFTPGTNVYKVRIVWEDINGSSTYDSVSLLYKAFLP